MKFFGEGLLGGSVGFTSSVAEGTVFRFSLPVNIPEDRLRELLT